MKMSIRHAEFKAQVTALKKKINRAQIKSANEAARQTMIYAQDNAPFRTGDLANGFSIRPLNKGARLINEVPGPFPWNKWVNQTPPYHNPPMRWNNFNPTLYRGVKRTASGRIVWWTGKAGFLNLAIARVRKKYKGMIVQRFKRL